jgi:glycosyltransferase involved in cell wall biosynthesis
MMQSLTRGLSIMKQQGPGVFLKKAYLKLKSWSARQKSAIQRVSTSQLRSDDYDAWIARYEPGPTELTRQAEAAKSFVYHPLISIITPVYNPVPEVLRSTIDSVLAQTYLDWELCIADGGSDIPEIREVLREYARRDSRIRPVLLDQNLGISGNSNAALQSVQGEFIALLDHDDILAPFALFEVAQKLNQDPELDLIYSDFDLLTNDGAHRYQPLFKPDWSPEIMFSACYITHLTVIRTKMISRVGGFDPQVDGAQDWDLFLRVSEQTHKVAHIPKILYHWRTAGHSTAEDIWAKPYAPIAQVRVIIGHLARLGLNEPKTFLTKVVTCGSIGRSIGNRRFRSSFLPEVQGSCLRSVSTLSYA